MADREEVIINLEQQIRWIEEIECHQFPGWLNVTNAMRDALALLKEQEAVEPVTESSVYDPDTLFFVCGSCKKSVIDRGDKFCRWCGTPVLWEGR